MMQVRLRDGFSHRMGIKKENTEMQLNALDDRTQISMLNAIDDMWNRIISGSSKKQKHTNLIAMNILSTVYSQPIDNNQSYVY